MALVTHCGLNVLTYVRKYERHLYTKQRFDGADTTEQISVRQFIFSCCQRRTLFRFASYFDAVFLGA